MDKGNSEFNWDVFDPNKYLSNNYESVHKSDAEILTILASFWRRFPIGKRTKMVDVGTGSNLYPILAALPYVSEIDCWEFGLQNILWLEREISKEKIEPCWQQFITLLEKETAVYSNIDWHDMLSHKVRPVQGSIFDLPKNNWDVATMFFCAESITRDIAEFEEAMRCFIDSIKDGGQFFAAFMENSQGYKVGDVDFPAIALNEEMLAVVLEKLKCDATTIKIGIHGRALRKGYSGMLLAYGSKHSGI